MSTRNKANLYEVFRSLSASTKGLGGYVVRDVFVGSEFEYDKIQDIEFPAVLFEFPVLATVQSPVKTYSLAYQVIDRIDLPQAAGLMDWKTQSDMLAISSKVEQIGDVIYRTNLDNFELSGWTMENNYDIVIDVEKYKDYTVRARFEFDLQIPLSQCFLD